MANEAKSSDESPRPWHRLFGLLLSDYLADSPFSVEMEIDLSHHKQLLDVIVVRKRPGINTQPMPDGLQDLIDYNLISFKSFQDTLDDWTLKELTGHYVNYRKQVSQKGVLISENSFRLYAVCARHPRDLLSQVTHTELQTGVYECNRGTDRIRIVVANDLPLEERNSLLHLFSAVQARVEYGALHHRLQSEQTSTLVYTIFNCYQAEGMGMPYTMEDFRREFLRDNYTLKERLEGLKPQQILTALTPQEILSSISRKDILAYLNRATQKKPSTKRVKTKPKKKQ